MSMETVISQSVLVILAGFDTTSNSLSFIVYFLAKHQEEQKKIRKELLKLIEVDGEVTYQNIMEAQYLDAFISESLRLFGPVHFNERVCTKSYKLSDSDVVIPKDMVVSIPNWSLHRDPEYWPDPLTFKPERFLPENKGNIKPFTYLPFGSGPRNCIGMRFAQLEVKLALATLCLNLELELRPGYKEPILEKTINTLRPDKSGVQLVVKRIRPSK